MTDHPRRTVWKYRLQHDQVITLEGLVDAHVIHVALDPMDAQPVPSVWIEHGRWDDHSDEDTEARVGPLRLTFIGTGHDVPQPEPPGYALHVGSCVCGPFLWHVYEVVFAHDLPQPEPDEPDEPDDEPVHVQIFAPTVTASSEIPVDPAPEPAPAPEPEGP